MKCAVLGLEPDGLMGEAFLVPYGNVATFQAGFKGLCKLARQSGEIDDIWAEVVYEGDEFDEEKGLAPRIVHKPCKDFTKRGGLLAAYAVARFKGGATRARVIYGDEIEKVKQLVKKRLVKPRKHAKLRLLKQPLRKKHELKRRVKKRRQELRLHKLLLRKSRTILLVPSLRRLQTKHHKIM
jgi:phage RecT family recombinase